jgi:hypothetical protein
MTNSLNQIIFFFLHQNQNIFFSKINIPTLVLSGKKNLNEKKHHKPSPLQVKWSVPKEAKEAHEFNIRLYDKFSESDYFFFPPPKSEYFFQQHWESEYFFRKKP